MKKPIVSLTSKDFNWDYFNGSGKGGQNRNKRANCVRCSHGPSGAVGKAEDERDLHQNKKLAFKRCCEKPEFQRWLRIEAMKRTGVVEAIERKVEQELKKVKVEIKDGEGRWKEVTDVEVLDRQQGDCGGLQEGSSS